MMSSSRVAAAALSTIFITALAAAPAAQTKRPDFSGRWDHDFEASKALTEKKGHEWRVAGAGAGGANAGTPPPGAVIMRPITIITQSDAEIVIERRWEDEVINRDVYKLDGSVSVNASRNTSSRSTTVWKGDSLVTTGTLEVDTSDMRDRNGQPVPNITRTFTTTRTLMPDGTLHVESRTVQDGNERVSWSVYVRAKQ